LLLDLLEADVEAKPEHLALLARELITLPVADLQARVPQPIVLLGMGSSRFAADRAARRLRARGLLAWADYSTAADEYANRDLGLVVLISASGSTSETLEAYQRLKRCGRTVAVTNDPDSPLAELADVAFDVMAGPERSGAVVRSMIHTHLVLDRMTEALTDHAPSSHLAAERAGEAVSDLLQRKHDWLPEAADVLESPDGLYFLAPSGRMASALQSALVIREVPRLPASACETHDWSHIDVYLTKSTTYRAVMFGRTGADREVMEWMESRGSAVASVGADVEGAATVIRYPYDSDRQTSDAVDTVVAELLAITWTRARAARGGGDATGEGARPQSDPA
jgi:glucosamine--fructose-6-phosphate aminotransferase (isomerizing)